MTITILTQDAAQEVLFDVINTVLISEFPTFKLNHFDEDGFEAHAEIDGVFHFIVYDRLVSGKAFILSSVKDSVFVARFLRQTANKATYTAGIAN